MRWFRHIFPFEIVLGVWINQFQHSQNTTVQNQIIEPKRTMLAAMLAFQVSLFYSFLFHVHAGYISNLVLFDTSVNPGKNLGPLESGRVVDIGVTGTALSVVANVDSKTPGGVQFVFDNSFTNTESNPIYALNGNAGTQLYPFQPLATVGAHTIITKFYNSTSKVLLETNTISFTIVQGPFTGFNLVNTNTNQETPLTTIVKLADVGTALSILAMENIENTIDYVSFWFDGAFVRTEQGAPWALAGNNIKRMFPYDPLLIPGIHTITAEATGFNNENLGAMTYTFTVQGISPMSVPVNIPIASPNGNLAPVTKKPAVAPVAVPSPITSPNGNLAPVTKKPAVAPVAVPSPVIAPTIPTPTSGSVEIKGERRKWHKMTLVFTGPFATETDANINPFMDYRLDVNFTHSVTRKQYVVPGYFAADGNAAETSASSGKKWHCHFAPDEIGLWNYDVTFVTGNDVAVNGGGVPTSFHGAKGSFAIAASNKTGRDHRGKGRLQYVGQHHLQFAEGEWFLKTGVDSPENFLAYEDFDNTPNIGNYRKSWEPHKVDYQSGDPTWQGGKGTGIIGAVNYLSNEGLNAFSFLTMNIKGDDDNVFPYISDAATDRLRMDVSKLAQWEILFEHADKMGMYLHVKLMETENDELLDGGLLGNERKLYYREIIARFGHHLALNWNLSEEITNPITQIKEFADYIKAIDPYKHIIVIHTWSNSENIYLSLSGHSTIDGVSLQTNPGNVFSSTLQWVKESAADGHKWVVANDEQNPAKVGLVPDSIDPDHDNIRENVLWANFMVRLNDSFWSGTPLRFECYIVLSSNYLSFLQ
jgi:Domain of unknown function (DUF5060)